MERRLPLEYLLMCNFLSDIPCETWNIIYKSTINDYLPTYPILP